MTTLTKHMDTLARRVADLQRAVAETNADSLPLINSEIYGIAEGRCEDCESVRGMVADLAFELQEVCDSAQAALDAHAALEEELRRCSPQK